MIYLSFVESLVDTPRTILVTGPDFLANVNFVARECPVKDVKFTGTISCHEEISSPTLITVGDVIDGIVLHTLDDEVPIVLKFVADRWCTQRVGIGLKGGSPKTHGPK